MRAFWVVLIIFGNIVFASAVIHRDALPWDVLAGVSLFTFYTDFGGALLFLARDADYYLAGMEPPLRA